MPLPTPEFQYTPDQLWEWLHENSPCEWETDVVESELLNNGSTVIIFATKKDQQKEPLNSSSSKAPS